MEACAPVDKVELTVPAHEEAELHFVASTGDRPWTAWQRPTGLGAHTFTIPGGQCRRYTFHWDGLDDTGRPLPPGSYVASGGVLGDWTTGEAGQAVPFVVV